MVRMFFVGFFLVGCFGFANSFSDLVKRSFGVTGSLNVLLEQIVEGQKKTESKTESKEEVKAQICKKGGRIRASNGQACKDAILYSLAFHICDDFRNFKSSGCAKKGSRALAELQTKDSPKEIAKDFLQKLSSEKIDESKIKKFLETKKTTGNKLKLEICSLFSLADQMTICSRQVIPAK